MPQISIPKSRQKVSKGWILRGHHSYGEVVHSRSTVLPSMTIQQPRERRLTFVSGGATEQTPQGMMWQDTTQDKLRKGSADELEGESTSSLPTCVHPCSVFTTPFPLREVGSSGRQKGNRKPAFRSYFHQTLKGDGCILFIKIMLMNKF